ncbi:dockerin type I domain-containing protein [Thalassolituus pacificus]|uniref:Dockerin type I domain-containing protein n=1 Tax=Thalassolituus pacificus TaxID=2975440 RepID=A0A9X2WGX0_9GAMM|nr:dockerin type I domain-containing protein [Thalassolituus pacificus]
MKNYKKFLTTALLGLALLLTGQAKAELVDSLLPVPVEEGWNQSLWKLKLMHSSPNGRYFSYIEYAGESIDAGALEYSQERALIYRYVVFDRDTGSSLHTAEISATKRLSDLAVEQLFLFPTDEGGLYFSSLNGDENDGIYYLNSNGVSERVFENQKMLFSLSSNGRYFLLSTANIFEENPENLNDYSFLDKQEGISYSLDFLEGYSFGVSGSYYITDNGKFIVESRNPSSFQLVDSVTRSLVDAELLIGNHIGGDFSFGNGVLFTPDGQGLVARVSQNNEVKIVYYEFLNDTLRTYSMADLGLTASTGSTEYTRLDITNISFGLSGSTGVDRDGIIHYYAYSTEQQRPYLGIFSLKTGQLLELSSLISESDQRGFNPIVAGGPGGSYYFLRMSFTEEGGLLPGGEYFYRPIEGASQALKIVTPAQVIDTFYSPQFSLDIKTLGEHYAVDASCTLNGPAALASASYGNWGSANRLQLPLQWQGQSLSGALSQTAPDAAVDGEQTLFNTVVLAEMTTDTLTVNCSGDMSDASGHLLSVMPDTITITLDDGIHGGNSAVNGQIVLPGGVSAEDVVVNITIDGRTISVTPDENGNFSFSGLRAGDFTVDFQSEGYVQSCMNATLDGTGNHDFGQIELLAGDINQDGAIDIADFTFLSGRYGTQQGEESYVQAADLNKDTVINVQDLAILASHFGSQQCNP